jgi:hypothetical protein
MPIVIQVALHSRGTSADFGRVAAVSYLEAQGRYGRAGGSCQPTAR